MSPQPGTKWRDVETGEIVEVDSFDGAYAVVCGEESRSWRGQTHSGKQNAFLVQPSHFGTNYLPV